LGTALTSDSDQDEETDLLRLTCQ